MTTTHIPAVSVVMAAYNTEKTIRKSVQSVLSQTFGDFELLIGDDCSTDRTYAILQDLKASDPRISLYKNETNMGQAFTRNMLFGHARADVIAIMDADDISQPERLSRQVAFFKAHPEYDYVATCIRWIDDKDIITDKFASRCGEVFKEDYLWGLPFLHPTAMFTKKAIQAVGGYWVDNLTRFRNEDYDMLMKMCALGFRGYVLPEPLYIYYEGSAAFKRRKYCYRWAEAKIRYTNFCRLGLMPKGLIYVLKPLIVGLFPQALLEKVRALKHAKE